MKPILTLTVNPSIDSSASADVIAPIRKIRTSEERYHPGGGGINVARVVHELGGNTLALYLAGGATGAILEDLLSITGIGCHRIATVGQTRIAHTIFERSTGQEYRFVPQGPTVSPSEWSECLEALALIDFDYVVISGSLPAGLPDTAYVSVVDIATQKRARVILDTSGEALRATLEKGVFLVKPNLRELEDLVGRPLSTVIDQVAAARALIASESAELVAITLGGDGALIVSQTEVWQAAIPSVTARSAVGAGDSFLGGATLALAQERSLDAVLAYAVSAGTSAVLSPGAELSQSYDVERLYVDLRRTIVCLSRSA